MLCEPQIRNRIVSFIGIVILLKKALKKKTIFFCQSKFTIMDGANLQRKISYSVFLRQKKILQVRNWQSNQSWLKDSRHQSLIANWLIKARRFCIITIWCEVKMRWNERGVKWLWGEMNVGWNERGVKWTWGEMNVGWNDMGWSDMGWNDFGVKWTHTESNISLN